MIKIISIAIITEGCVGLAASSWFYDLNPKCLSLVYALICKMGIRILFRIQKLVMLE